MPEQQNKCMFLCDGAVENCKKTHCFMNGGDCRKTSDINHAVNFKKWPNGSYSEMSQDEKMREKNDE